MPKSFKFIWFFPSLQLFLLLLFSPILHAAYYDDEPVISTQPMGSPFYRHLAQETGLDLRELVKYEKRGFGRTEIIMLISISSTTGKPLKDFAQRRLKDKVTLRALAAEQNLNYDEILKYAREMKERIEFLGPDALPPPLFELPPAETVSKSAKKKEKKAKPK